MDISEGWGLVIGAVATGAFVLAAGVVAYRAGRRQVADQAAAEQRAWLRQRREEAYTSLLAAADEVMDKLNEVMRIRARPDYDENTELRLGAWGLVNVALRDTSRAVRRISIVGPSEEMPARAQELYEALHEVADTQRATVPFDERVIAFSQAMERRENAEHFFVEGANEVLHSAQE